MSTVHEDKPHRDVTMTGAHLSSWPVLVTFSVTSGTSLRASTSLMQDAAFPQATRNFAIKVFVTSGDRFFKTFKTMHDKLLASTDLVPTLADADARAPTSEDIQCVLRLWAGELKPPKKRKGVTLHEKAHSLVEDKLTHAMCRAICLHLAWDTVMEMCAERQGRAEGSTFWDDDSNDQRIAMWESRNNIMSTYEGTLENLAVAASDGDTAGFLDALTSFAEELDCE